MKLRSTAVLEAGGRRALSSLFEPLLPAASAGLTAAFLGGVGDSIAQGSAMRSRDSRSYDLRRGLSFAVFGFWYTGVFQHFWFSWLNANMPRFLGSSPLAHSGVFLGAMKTVLNQCGMVPLLYYPLFFSLTGLLESRGPLESLKQARQQGLVKPLLLRGWAFWLPTQVAMFAFVPQPLQLTFLCVAGICWTAILSLYTAAKKPEEFTVVTPAASSSTELFTLPLRRPAFWRQQFEAARSDLDRALEDFTTVAALGCAVEHFSKTIRGLEGVPQQTLDDFDAAVESLVSSTNVEELARFRAYVSKDLRSPPSDDWTKLETNLDNTFALCHKATPILVSPNLSNNILTMPKKQQQQQQQQLQLRSRYSPASSSSSSRLQQASA